MTYAWTFMCDDAIDMEYIYIYKAELENAIQVNKNIHIYIKYAVLHNEV